MIFGPSDAEFQEVFEGIKKWIYQKWPKQRDSNGRPVHEVNNSTYVQFSLPLQVTLTNSLAF